MQEYHYIIIAENEEDAAKCINQNVFARMETKSLRKEWRD